MNPGYLSYILYSLAVILICTGWFTENVKGNNRKWMWLFAVMWPLLSWVSISIFGSITIQGAFLLLLIAIVIFWLKVKSDQKISALTLGFLLGSVVYLLKEMMKMDPVLVVLDADFNIALLLTLIVLFAFSNLSARMFSITFGLVMGDYLTFFSNPYLANTPVLLGDRSFQDLWWLTAAMVVISSKLWSLSHSKVSSYILAKRGVRSE
jgi:hypothetical protein